MSEWELIRMQHVKLLRSDIDEANKNEIETHIFTLEQFEDQLCLQDIVKIWIHFLVQED